MNIKFDQIYDNENHENIQNSYISNKFQNNNENIEIYVNELPEAKNKKIKISYEDILTSLNMTVIDGKLHYLNNNFINQNKINFNQTRHNNNRIQFMNKNNNQNVVINKSNFSNSNYNLQNRSNIQNKKSNSNVEVNSNNKIPPVPSVPPVPPDSSHHPGANFNKEQYKRFILIQRIQKLQAQQRINKMKPKKMFFSDDKNNNIFFNNHKQINNNNFNRLFNFRS